MFLYCLYFHEMNKLDQVARLSPAFPVPTPPTHQHNCPLVLEIHSELREASHSKWNVTQNGVSLKMECNSKLNVTQYGMSLKMECHLKWNALKMECHSKLNVTQNGM